MPCLALIKDQHFPPDLWLMELLNETTTFYDLILPGVIFFIICLTYTISLLSFVKSFIAIHEERIQEELVETEILGESNTKFSRGLPIVAIRLPEGSKIQPTRVGSRGNVNARRSDGDEVVIAREVPPLILVPKEAKNIVAEMKLVNNDLTNSHATASDSYGKLVFGSSGLYGMFSSDPVQGPFMTSRTKQLDDETVTEIRLKPNYEPQQVSIDFDIKDDEVLLEVDEVETEESVGTIETIPCDDEDE